MTTSITPDQLKRLQTLYQQYERHSLDCPGATRLDRIAWASAAIGRPVASFKDLHMVEAKRLIDGLQAHLGTKYPAKRRRRVQSAKDGQKAGTEGRHDQIHNETTLASPSDIARIQRIMSDLGWDQAGLQRFLASSRSPLRDKKSGVIPRTTILTLGDANKVYWSLKRIAQRKPAPETTAQKA